MSGEEWIARLGLERHPEGGWFRETYRSADVLPASGLPSRFAAPHAASTAIYFLLQRGEISALHRLKSDELWHFYDGAPLTVHVIAPDGRLTRLSLGPGLKPGAYGVAQFQAVVPAGHWFGATLETDDAAPGLDFALVGCTVAPGFDFADFELADRAQFLGQFPQHSALIQRLTR